MSPAGPVEVLAAQMTTGTGSPVVVGSGVRAAAIEVRGGKTGTVQLQGSVTGALWLNVGSATTWSTAGRIVGTTWAAPVSRLRARVTVLSAATSSGRWSTGVTMHVAVPGPH